MLYLVHKASLSDHRIEIFEGEEHLVIPTVAAVQGVLNNQLLPIASLEASLPAWEGVPVTMSHPKHLGQDISANTIEGAKFIIGRFFNAHIDGTKFKGEFWINLEKLDAHEDGELFMGLVESGAVVEVSTAYWCHTDNQSGVYEGKKYSGVQTNLIPNHVAILPHEVGACSVADGCGAPRVNEQETEMDEPTGDAPVEGDEIQTNEDDERRTSAIKKLVGKFGKMVMDTFGLSANRISHDQIRRNLREMIVQDERSDAFVFIVDVFDDQVVYGRELPSGEVDLLSRNYSLGDGPSYEINLEDPVEVEQVVTYEPVQNQEESMDREATIERLATNEEVPFDRDALTAMTDDQLSHLVSNLDAGSPEGGDAPASDTDPTPAASDASAPDTQPEGVTNALTSEVAEALNTLGADGIQQVVLASNALAEQRKQERDGLISRLVANEAVTLDEPTLRRMDLEALQGVARMVGVGTSYAGLGGPAPQTNRSSGPGSPPSVILPDAE